jgi:prepilin-type N-terminal cleavage/methylation domain-containing protein
MEKGFSKIELLVTTAIMATLASGIVGNIQKSREKILTEGARMAVKYEGLLELECEDVKDSIIRKLLKGEPLSEEEDAYAKAVAEGH